MKATKTTSNTKKTSKKLPVLGTIDLTDVNTFDDVLVETIYAKIRTAINAQEYVYFVNSLIEDVVSQIDSQNETIHWAIEEVGKIFAPKKPWYKRLWNKIFGK